MKILLIDDDADIVAIYYTLFTSKGHDLIGASSAAEAMQIVQDTIDFDVCMTDYQLPDLIGPELISLLTPLMPEVYFVLFTAHDKDYASMKTLNSQIVTVIQKPVPFIELEQILLKISGHRERQGHTGT